MTIRFALAGLALGMTAAVCASAARADDLRTAESLVETGVFLSHVETEAAFARLDAPQPDASQPAGKTAPQALYWESGAASYGQDERDGRLGYGGSTTLMRLGYEKSVTSTAKLGFMASAGFGSVGSGDLASDTIGRHADFYGMVSRGSLFVKMLAGASLYDFPALDRGSAGDRSRASAAGSGARAATQFGGSFRFAGVKFTPSVALAAYANRLSPYDECGGADPLSFDGRSADAAIGTVRLGSQKSLRLDPGHTVEVNAFLSAESVVAFRASQLVAAAADGLKTKYARAASPRGRGLVGGLGLGTDIAPGVNLSVNSDYGLRDGLATYASRAKLGVSF